MAGYPSFSRCRELVWDAAEAGADLIELGIPFSDPVADGPTIQAALHHALQRGVTVRRCLDFVRRLRREGFVAPIFGMTYANLVYAPGLARSARDWNQAGLDGAIIPDLPVEESGPWRAALGAQGLASVELASPTTSTPRVRQALRSASGFLYLVAVYGTTGARRGLAPETAPLIRRVRNARAGPRPPVCVGFGVSAPKNVADLRRAGAEGVIVGSALVERIRRGENAKAFLSSLSRAASRGSS